MGKKEGSIRMEVEGGCLDGGSVRMTNVARLKLLKCMFPCHICCAKGDNGALLFDSDQSEGRGWRRTVAMQIILEGR